MAPKRKYKMSGIRCRITAKGRECIKCRRWKPWTSFPSNKASKSGFYCKCKVCLKEYREKNRHRQCAYLKEYYRTHSKEAKAQRLFNDYGLSIQDFEALYRAQKGRCAICSRKLSMYPKGKTRPDMAAVDHCHKTGLVRGLLCANCNRGLGYFKDSPQLLQIAIRYLSLKWRF